MHYRLLASFLLVFGMASAVQADPPRGRSGDAGHDRQERRDHDRDDDRGRERHEKAEKYKKHEARGHFIDDDRIVVREYYNRNPSHLPPGLAKRGGSLPPGLAKRGGALPPGLSKGQVVDRGAEAHLLPLPRELELRLPPPPHEVIRRIIGRDIVLIHERNKQVLDVLRDALPGH